jgi:hypothetical protein
VPQHPNDVLQHDWVSFGTGRRGRRLPAHSMWEASSLSSRRVGIAYRCQRRDCRGYLRATVMLRNCARPRAIRLSAPRSFHRNTCSDMDGLSARVPYALTGAAATLSFAASSTEVSTIARLALRKRGVYAEFVSGIPRGHRAQIHPVDEAIAQVNPPCSG